MARLLPSKGATGWAPFRTVTIVTAIGHALCFLVDQKGGATMLYDSWRNPALIEERSERPLLTALFAVVVAWSIAILITLA